MQLPAIDLDPTSVERLQALTPVPTPELAGPIRAWRAAYLRPVPAHYRANPLTRPWVDLTLLLVEGGRLFIPSSPEATFQPFFEELRRADPQLMRQVVSPSGTAKAASTSQFTAIKELTRRSFAGFSLPGDAERYGWDALAADAARAGLRPALFFQGNGLYFNRGSLFFDGRELYDYPNAILADLLESGDSPANLAWLGIDASALQRPLLLFTLGRDGHMRPLLHRFQPGERYPQGMARLRAGLLAEGCTAALAASPPLILPGPDGQPDYLDPPAILSVFHANDVRHSLYCPYAGGILLSPELGRAQCLRPARLAASLSGSGTILLPLHETLHVAAAGELPALLESKGYAGRFHLDLQRDPPVIELLPLEGVYSHLVVFLTAAGRFGILQTSGTHGNITGNDGPTLGQLCIMLRDLNTQPLFAQDPILAAASGSQGNDVPNVLALARDGRPALLAEAAPQLSLDEHPIPRGVVTTPRVAIAC